jgi:hypothetical protein
LRGAIFELRLRETLERSFVSSLEALLDLNRRMARRSHDLELVMEDGFPRELSEGAEGSCASFRRRSPTSAATRRPGVSGQGCGATVTSPACSW